MSSKPKEEEHDQRRHDPGVAFVDVNEVVSDEARNQRTDTDNDDANDEGKRPWVY